MNFLKVCDDEQESEDSEDKNGGLLNQINYRPKDIIDTPLIYEIKKSHNHITSRNLEQQVRKVSQEHTILPEVQTSQIEYSGTLYVVCTIGEGKLGLYRGLVWHEDLNQGLARWRQQSPYFRVWFCANNLY